MFGPTELQFSFAFNILIILYAIKTRTDIVQSKKMYLLFFQQVFIYYDISVLWNFTLLDFSLGLEC